MTMPILPESATAARAIMRQLHERDRHSDLTIICAALLYHARRSHQHAVEDIGLMSDSDRADTDLRILNGRTLNELHRTALALAVATVHDWADSEQQAHQIIEMARGAA